MTSPEIPDILKEIIDLKRERVLDRKKTYSISKIENLISDAPYPLNFAGRLMGDSVRIIAEIKKASPSKGVFRDDLDILDLAVKYAESDVAAISVLTNEDHFHGSIDDMKSVSDIVHPYGIPVLRKEFIFDPYQIYEARAFGADAILLIVTMLNPRQIEEFMELASSLWIQCLVEVHDEIELRVAIDCGAEIIGINNRDLKTFETTLKTTESLAPLVPPGTIIVSESGISNRSDVDRVMESGAGAILVGESLVKSSDPSGQLKELGSKS